MNGKKLTELDVRVLTNPVLYNLHAKKPEYLSALEKKRLNLPENVNKPENLKEIIFKTITRI